METKASRKKMNKKVRKLETLMAEMVVRNPPVKKKRKRTRTKRQEGRSARMQDGELRLKKKELLASLAIPKGSTEMVNTHEIKPETFPWLGNVAKSFEKVKWHQMKVYWKPAVGTTVGGLVTFGIRWEYDKKSETRPAVAAQTPSKTGAVWEDGERNPMVVPANRLMTRTWYIIGAGKADGGPGQLEVGVTGPEAQVLGEVWVEYTVTLAGTRASA